MANQFASKLARQRGLNPDTCAFSQTDDFIHQVRTTLIH
jgi:hypothetical protein